LAHEVAHTLGLKEIYDNAYGDDSIVDGTTWHNNGTEESNMCIMKRYEYYDTSELFTQTVDGQASALSEYCIAKLHTKAIKDSDLYES
jgi:hypothetical protein